MEPTYSPPSDFYILNASEIVEQFVNNWKHIVEVKYRIPKAFVPDVSYIAHQVIDAIKYEQTAIPELAMTLHVDISAIMWHQLKSRLFDDAAVIDIKNELVEITTAFGRALIQQLRDDGIYRDGYLPCEFAGWFGDTILLSLDESYRRFMTGRLHPADSL